MDRTEFISQLGQAENEINHEWLMRVLKESIESNLYDGNPRGYMNLIIVMEELSELTKEISKYLRGKGNSYGILEELADVQLGIYYVQEICDIKDKDLHQAMNVKMNRLEDVLNKVQIRKSLLRRKFR